jgi:glycosyltransferase involved in cell wall biosynthesis
VAIYAPNASSLYLEGGGPVAGAERQAGYLAEALAARGFRVRHIVKQVPGRRLREEPGAVEPVLLRGAPDDRRVARYRSIASALALADARLYIQFCASFETGLVGTWARLHRRRFVFRTSSDSDFAADADTPRMVGTGLEHRRTMIQYRIGLSMAERIVVQTDRQRELARSRFGIEDARVLASFVELPPASARPHEAFLWIGGIVDAKDPLAYVELARRAPEATFWMVVAKRRYSRQELVDRLFSEAAEVPNLELLPPMPSDAVLSLYEQAVAVVSTSFVEGFPNVFLEGWARGAPVLSLRVDPDGVIAKHGLGAACDGSMDELAAAARRLWSQRDTIDPERGRSYVARFHDPVTIGRQWAGLVSELLGG